MSQINIKNIHIFNIGPKFLDIQKSPYNNFIKLLVKGPFEPKHIEFEISKANTAIANALRRTILSEMECAILYFDMCDIETDDSFILIDDILNRIEMISIMQDIPDNAEFTLDLINTDYLRKSVYSGDIKQINGKKGDYFYPNIHLFDLLPNKYIRIPKIIIKKFTGYENGRAVLACNGSSIAIDEIPLDFKTQTGISSSMSNAKQFRISFNINGNIEAKKLIKLACDNIIRRLENVRKLLYTIVSSPNSQSQNDEIHKLIIHKETETIGKLLSHAVHDLYPNIKAVSSNFHLINHILTIQIKSNNPSDMLDTAIEKSIDDMKKIKSFF